MSTLDGPRLPPASGNRPKQIVIFAHGYGSNGDDLIGLAPYLAQALPDAAFVSPNAPEPVPGYPAGRQWFPISRLDPQLMAAGVQGAARHLDGFIDAELARHELPPAACGLVGFSQGTMMALHVGLRRAEPLGALLGLSGMLADAGPIRTRPPVALVHGSEDEVIPIGALFASLEGLAAQGVPALWRISHGAGHTVAEDGLALGAAFLRDALAGRFAGWTAPGARPS
jgi:phospholipase/carboxylesterase